MTTRLLRTLAESAALALTLTLSACGSAEGTPSAYAHSSPLVAAAVLYLVITLRLTQLVNKLEQRQQRAR